MIPLKSKKIFYKQSFFIDTIQWACWNATPEHTTTLKIHDCPILNKKIEEKRRLRRG
jgi:hypothetical protein